MTSHLRKIITAWHVNRAALLFLLSLLCLSASLTAKAEPIYRWQDEAGRVYYSDRPRSTGDKPAQLPSLTRDDLDAKIDKIKAETPANCDKHGGVDCQKGPDEDGSVFCRDGFRNAVLPFRFRCLESRLEAEFFLIFGEGRVCRVERQKQVSSLLKNEWPTDLSVAVRNLSEVEAFGVKAKFIVPGIPRKHLAAAGPDRIPPYGFAEYSVSLAGVELPPTTHQWNGLKYKLECTNCGAILDRKN